MRRADSTRGKKMDWKAHLLFGIAIGTAIAMFALGASAVDAIVFVAVCGASALLPDLDLRKSKASQLAYAFAFSFVLCLAAFFTMEKGGKIEDFALYALLIAAALLALDLLFRPRHRGWMHGLLFACALFIACFAAFGWFLSAALFSGYLSHLLMDGCLKP